MSAIICSSDDVKEVGIDHGGLDDRGMGADFWRGRGFSYFHDIWTGLCPMDSGDSFPEAKRWGCEADGHLLLVPSLRMLGATLPLSIVFLWRGT